MPSKALESSPAMNLWCLQVIDTPELRRTRVFNRGTEKGSKEQIPRGGQEAPKEPVGASLLWKKAQKKLEKNITSERINKHIPQRIPNSTAPVCRP